MLVETPSAYEGRAVRVKGKFEMGASIGQRTYIMKDNFVAQILIFPVREIEGSFEQEALRALEELVAGKFGGEP